MSYTNEQQQILDAINNNQNATEEDLITQLGEADFKERLKNIFENELDAGKLALLKQLMIDFGFYVEK